MFENMFSQACDIFAPVPAGDCNSKPLNSLGKKWQLSARVGNGS